ncbi:hypothetical protein HD806DRAFT_53946 [Xylariaceae sp. AK1471]|nr:hypothetical protein HD806DRAFT_53946 [Xylariaceae sp. AK1471]
MHLFRRRFSGRNGISSRNETPAGSLQVASQDKADNITELDNGPPSYEDSQDASLREVLQSAREILPLLWHSATSSSTTIISLPTPTPTPSYSQADRHRNMISETLKNKKSAEDTSPRPTPGLKESETDIMDVLAHLATAPCGGSPFLDRIRQFSDFYFAPCIATGDCPGVQTTVLRNTIQEKQRKALQNIPGPRESAVLVLCARVLEGYYAELGHVDSTEDIAGNTTESPLFTEPSYEKYGDTKEGSKSANETRSQTGAGTGSKSESEPETHTKTRLTQIAACAEENCICYDYDPGIQAQPQLPNPNPNPNPKTPFLNPDLSPPHCSCGHPRTSHSHSSSSSPSSPSSTALGISRLLHHYTNWYQPAYSTLKHRSSTNHRKSGLAEIETCSPPGMSCPCRDYDKGSSAGQCGLCGHAPEVHIPTKILQREQDPETRAKGAGKGDFGAGLGQREGEWELSWILVENAYLLLH